MDEPARILCVDDEKNVLRALERIFLDEELEIFTASSAEEGLDVLTRHPVPVIVSDYRMPGMNGVDFLKKVCERWPDTIRIVLSGYADTGTIVAAINEGQIYKFIPKPWNDDELKVTILKAVEHYFLRRSNQELSGELQRANDELRLLNENLEKRVEERTNEVLFRSRALVAAQNILDALPVALLGIDPEGQIVQCNRKGGAFFAGRVGDLLGRSCEEVLPPELVAFVRNIPRSGERSEEVAIGDQSVTVKGTWFEGQGRQRGLILLLHI
jgi:two-component system NtrC family sensor kinase